MLILTTDCSCTSEYQTATASIDIPVLFVRSMPTIIGELRVRLLSRQLAGIEGYEASDMTLTIVPGSYSVWKVVPAVDIYKWCQLSC